MSTDHDLNRLKKLIPNSRGPSSSATLPFPAPQLQAVLSSGLSASSALPVGAVLRPFPFRTFDQIAALGLEVAVYCASCHRHVGPIDLADARLKGWPFSRRALRLQPDPPAFRRRTRRALCSLGALYIRPRPGDRIPPQAAVPWCSIACPRCVPYWEVEQAARHLPPWDQALQGAGGRLACPACRSPLATVWLGCCRFHGHRVWVS